MIRKIGKKLTAFGIVLGCLAILFGSNVFVWAWPEEPNAASATPQKQWFKGNLHTHSLWSDGNDYPEMIADWYKQHGYHFLALSDHNILSQGDRWMNEKDAAKRGDIAGLQRYKDRFGEDWVETREVNGELQVRLKPLNEFRSMFEEAGRFMMIESEEITDKFESHPIHINAHNLRDTIKPQGGGSIRETIANNLAAVKEQGLRTGRPTLAHLNHPNFYYSVTAEDMAAVLEEKFFEVYNGHPGVDHLGDKEHPSVERLWDIANTIRLSEMKAPPLYGMATDDSHNYFGTRGASTGRGWVMVLARRLTSESLIHAMQHGDFYASSGVSLKEVRFDSDSRTLEVVVDPVEGESYTTQFIGTLRNYDPRHEPVLDKDGKPIHATHRYSNEIGKVLATVEGNTARYVLSGEELYVRAVVNSSAVPENPSFKEQKKQAWTQPFGWEKWIVPDASVEKK